MSTLITVFTSAVVATVVGIALDVWRESHRNKRATRLEALNVAILLEGYAIACANKIADHETAQSSDGHAGQYMASIPDLPELTVTVGFLRPKKASVANKLLMFPQAIKQADQEAGFWWDVVGDIECARNAAKNCTAKIGLESISLAQQLRSAFDLPERKLIFGKYDVSEQLDKSIQKVTE